MSDYNDAVRTGMVRFGYDFGSVAEMTRLFGPDIRVQPNHICFPIPGKADTIAVFPAENGGRGYGNIPHRGTNADGRGWRQIERYDEVNPGNPEAARKRCEEELARPLCRYLFWHENFHGASWYKFHGIFKIDAEATRASLEAGENACIYRKVADTCECLKAPWPASKMTSGEIDGLGGREIEAVLRNCLDGTVLWPGDRLRVTGVAPAVVRAETIEGGEKLEIPRRDFELGYFRICD